MEQWNSKLAHWPHHILTLIIFLGMEEWKLVVACMYVMYVVSNTYCGRFDNVIYVVALNQPLLAGEVAKLLVYQTLSYLSVCIQAPLCYAF